MFISELCFLIKLDTNWCSMCVYIYLQSFFVQILGIKKRSKCSPPFPYFRPLFPVSLPWIMSQSSTISALLFKEYVPLLLHAVQQVYKFKCWFQQIDIRTNWSTPSRVRSTIVTRHKFFGMYRLLKTFSKRYTLEHLWQRSE